MSDYLPQRLPFDPPAFRPYLCLFSVYALVGARGRRRRSRCSSGALSERGLLVITIRPVEYWRIHKGLSAPDRAALEAAHAARGFAYRPHNRTPVDGDITYGDTSMTLEYFEKQFPWLSLRKVEQTVEDPYQTVLFLTKKTSI